MAAVLRSCVTLCARKWLSHSLDAFKLAQQRVPTERVRNYTVPQIKRVSFRLNEFPADKIFNLWIFDSNVLPTFSFYDN